jgi:hypothetical protein
MTMPLFPQLLTLAALDDILEVVLPIIFLILYVVGQLLAGKNKAKRPGRQPPRPVAPPGPQGGVGGQGVDQPLGLEAALRQEVDEFLRRAQGGPVQDQPPRRAEKARKKLPRQGSKTTTGRKTTAMDSKRARRARAGDRPLPSQAAEQRPGPAMIAPNPATGHSSISTRGLPSATTRAEQPADNLRRQSVTAHVAAHIDHGTRAIGQHAEHLADSLEQTDERVQQRIEQKFEHQVGRLQHQEVATEVQGADLAEEFANLLRSPEGMRQLVIAKEILDRPYQ